MADSVENAPSAPVVESNAPVNQDVSNVDTISQQNFSLSAC